MQKHLSTAQSAVLKRLLRWLILCLLSSFPLLANAAQLINSLPATLDSNWQICLHFDASTPECKKESLPELYYQLPVNIKHQTYSKNFIPSSDLKKQPLGIWLKNVDDVDKIFINDILIGKTGQFLPKFESGFRQERFYLIPHSLINFNQFNHIEIHTFSSRQQPGIQNFAPVIDNFLDIQQQNNRKNYTYLIVGTILLLLIIFPVFYFIVVKGNYETVYFFCFLIGFAFIAFARSQLPGQWGLDLSSAYKLESFMLNFSLIATVLFLFAFFELELRRTYITGIFILGLAGMFLIVWPYPLYLRKVAEYNYWSVILGTFFIAGSALIIALHKQRKYASIITASCFIGWLALVYDAVIHSKALFEINFSFYPQVAPVASAFIAITFTLLLTHKYWHFFKGSTYDHLTGTLLRPAFFQRLSEEMHRCRRSDLTLLVSVIEIQQAKKISINYGYSLGNHLLSTVSNSLTKVLRPYDLICRFSDEQFCIATTIKNQEDAYICVERIHNELISIQQPINEEIELYVDARIGGVIYNEEQHLSVSHLVQDANYALSKAKNEAKQSYLLEQSPLAGL